MSDYQVMAILLAILSLEDEVNRLNGGDGITDHAEHAKSYFDRARELVPS